MAAIGTLNASLVQMVSLLTNDIGQKVEEYLLLFDQICCFSYMWCICETVDKIFTERTRNSNGDFVKWHILPK